MIHHDCSIYSHIHACRLSSCHPVRPHTQRHASCTTGVPLNPGARHPPKRVKSVVGAANTPTYASTCHLTSRNASNSASTNWEVRYSVRANLWWSSSNELWIDSKLMTAVRPITAGTTHAAHTGEVSAGNTDCSHQGCSFS